MKQPDILKRIVHAKRARVGESKSMLDLQRFYEEVSSKQACVSPCFSKAFTDRSRINIVAEIKRASPSKGLLAEDVDIGMTVRDYESAGASAISVLTEEDFFMGGLEDLSAVVDSTSLPVLRKDFIFDEFQIYESAHWGANAILLIAAILDDMQLKELKQTADRLGLDALIEVHNEEEMRRAIGLGAQLIGVNNRDLNSFEVTLATSERLCKLAPESTVLISESGLHTQSDITRLSALGFRGFLIGEALMTSPRPGATLKELMG